jgi:hypothetical protein
MKGADRRMILIDETKLEKGVISLIGECYDMYQGKEEDRDEFIDRIVERFYVGDKEEIIDFFKKI